MREFYPPLPTAARDEAVGAGRSPGKETSALVTVREGDVDAGRRPGREASALAAVREGDVDAGRSPGGRRRCRSPPGKGTPAPVAAG
jgi:hypothetical protein